MTKYPEPVWELAIAVNAAIKGLLGSLGESGHICERVEAVPLRLAVSDGWAATVRALVTAPVMDCVYDGSVVVVADKVVSVALGRVGPREAISNPDPKTIPAEALDALATKWQQALGFPISPKHMLVADHYSDSQASFGTDDPNGRANEIAEAVRRHAGTSVDVVISDTDTGIDTRTPLIGTLTIGATPLGATAGLTLYEAMRCAVAAEFARGHRRGIPMVVCHPAERRRVREHTGMPRSYGGFLDAAREELITHA